jgi:hypothetical protein
VLLEGLANLGHGVRRIGVQILHLSRKNANDTNEQMAGKTESERNLFAGLMLLRDNGQHMLFDVGARDLLFRQLLRPVSSKPNL